MKFEWGRMRTQMKDEGERRATACDGGKGKRAGIGRRSAFCDFAGFAALRLYGFAALRLRGFTV
ncbi:hypothetical protein BSIN_1019 [Burkholderia singularis]|uniref:Uncharacterized protein n=1 Tax=Burkholderia singularis TaxID=1503053 RepID=A0A238HCG5_9BURK|nr:hypothetical protein BSIN_1019 [Burkholderia singularis]